MHHLNSNVTNQITAFFFFFLNWLSLLSNKSNVSIICVAHFGLHTQIKRTWEYFDRFNFPVHIQPWKSNDAINEKCYFLAPDWITITHQHCCSLWTLRVLVKVTLADYKLPDMHAWAAVSLIITPQPN